MGDQRPFVSASLWKLSAGRPVLVASTGATALLPSQADRMAAFLAEAVQTPKLNVTGLLDGPDYRLGYAFTPDGTAPSFAVYAEGALPAGRRAVIEAGSPFFNLRFSLHLGHSTTANTMLETNVSKLPLHGRTATVEIPFGTETLSLVAGSRNDLGGNLSPWLWWIVGAAGILVTLAAALTSERLVRRRLRAERLAEQVEGLHQQQRTIAETLQHTLLPQKVPPIPGLDVAVRYLAGSDGMDIGGDWYDVIALDKDRFFFVIGDVSGRGVQAGSVMVSMHYAIRAFVSEKYSPVEVIQRLSAMLDVSRDGHFATVLCGVGDTRRHEVTVSNAGHLPLLLITDGGPRFLPAHVGPPIGVPAAGPYQAVTLSVPPGATLVAYTDGLDERRGEVIDDGFARLRRAATQPRQSVEDLVSGLVDELATENHSDDTAILGMRWLS